MTFGEKLQELRRKAGISQDSLAEKLDVSRQAVSKWERDEAMPETEKVVRIAQLFGVSTDYLLLDNARQAEPEPQPGYQQPAAPRSRYYQDQLRRHGYKLGYILTAIGAVICIFSLIAYFVWPAMGGSFLGSASGWDTYGNYDNIQIMIDAVGELPPEMESSIEDAILQEIGGPADGMTGLWGSSLDQMDGMMNSALKAQASLFLIGLVPGGILLTAGAFITVKGKKIAAAANISGE